LAPDDAIRTEVVLTLPAVSFPLISSSIPTFLSTGDRDRMLENRDEREAPNNSLPYKASLV
jgi:hypothetical protein